MSTVATPATPQPRDEERPSSLPPVPGSFFTDLQGRLRTAAGSEPSAAVNNNHGAQTLSEKPRHRVWLTIPDVLAELGIDRGTFDHWRRRGIGPRMKRLPNRTWRIRGDWFDEWVANLPEDSHCGDTLGEAA